MKPVDFKESNRIFAEAQDEYLNLPAFVDTKNNGEVISCWKLTFIERIHVLITGRVWNRCWTFNKPLQPLSLQVESPFVQEVNIGNVGEAPVGKDSDLPKDDK